MTGGKFSRNAQKSFALWQRRSLCSRLRKRDNPPGRKINLFFCYELVYAQVMGVVEKADADNLSNVEEGRLFSK